MAQWTQQQIDDLRGEYLKPRTTREFIDWWNVNGNLILMMYAVKNENIGYRDERKFWPVAKINADWDSFNKEFKEYVTELEKTEVVDWISHPELSPFAAYWSEPDEQTGGWKYIDDEALRIDSCACPYKFMLYTKWLKDVITI